MESAFTTSGSLGREQLDWGTRGWHTGFGKGRADSLVVIEVDLMPGHGHAFHFHPNQEELVYVLEGEVEQWVETKKRTLHPGDSTFIQKNTVHASYNLSDAPVKVLAILGPVIGEEGYEVVEVADKAPWNTIRQAGS